MPGCSAFGCFNNYLKSDCSVSFHKFPLSDKKLLRMWITKMRTKKFSPSATSRLCSEHFEPKCFLQQKSSFRRVLKKDAVPTIFSFIPQNALSQEPLHPESFPKTVKVFYPFASRDTGTRTESTQTELSFGNLIDELSFKNDEIERLKAKIEKLFVPEKMTNTELRFFSGLSRENFFKFLNFLNLENDFKSEKFSTVTLFLMFLMKLKTGISVDFLAYIFEASQSTISRTINRLKDHVFYKLQSESAQDELGVSFCSYYLSLTEMTDADLDNDLVTKNSKSQKREKRDVRNDIIMSAIETLESSENDSGDNTDDFGNYVTMELNNIEDEKLLNETKIAIQGIINDAQIRMSGKENVFL